MAEKKTKSKAKDFDPDKILLEKRKVFLNEGVDQDSALRVIKELMALDLKKVAPISLYLDSPGGSCSDGMAIIHTIRTIKSKVTTIINTEVCSMGGHISVAGNERHMSRNGCWMAHDMNGGTDRGEYSLKIKYRAEYLEKYYKTVLEENLRTYTDLTQEQLDLARAGELWLFAEDCLKYGIIDKIV